MANEYGPFSTEREASQTEAVRAANAAFDADPGAGKHIPHHLRILTDACEAAGVELGDYDARVLAWLANWEASTCVAVAGIIRRAAQPPEGTVTEWAVSYRPRLALGVPNPRVVEPCPTERQARNQVASLRELVPEDESAVVSHQVTPWTEAPEPAEDERHG